MCFPSHGCSVSPRGRGCRRLSWVRSSSLLCLVVRPHQASSGQIHDNGAVSQRGAAFWPCLCRVECAGCPHPLWAPQGLLGAVDQPRGASCSSWCSFGSGMEPGTAYPSANLPAGSSSARPVCSCPGMHRGRGCLEPEPQDFLEAAVKYHLTQGCRSPRNGGTLVPCHGLSVPCSSLHRGCGLTGRGRHRAGFHVKRAIKGRNLLTRRSV